MGYSGSARVKSVSHKVTGQPKDQKSPYPKRELTKAQRAIIRGGSICSACAKANGGAWPESHCATFWQGECIVCGVEQGCCCTTDWNFPWLKMRPGEREI